MPLEVRTLPYFLTTANYSDLYYHLTKFITYKLVFSFQVRYLLKSTRRDILEKYFPSAASGVGSGEGNANSSRSGSVSGSGGMRLRRFTRQFSETFMTQVGGGRGNSVSGRGSVTEIGPSSNRNSAAPSSAASPVHSQSPKASFIHLGTIHI